MESDDSLFWTSESDWSESEEERDVRLRREEEAEAERRRVYVAARATRDRREKEKEKENEKEKRKATSELLGKELFASPFLSEFESSVESRRESLLRKGKEKWTPGSKGGGTGSGKGEADVLAPMLSSTAASFASLEEALGGFGSFASFGSAVGEEERDDEREIVGYEVEVGRDGKERRVAEVWAKKPPAPNADHRPGEGEDRRLAARMGWIGSRKASTVPKREVEEERRPADRGQGAGKEKEARRAAEEVAMGQVWMNGKGMQPFSEMEEGRGEGYDGWNPKLTGIQEEMKKRMPGTERGEGTGVGERRREGGMDVGKRVEGKKGRATRPEGKGAQEVRRGAGAVSGGAGAGADGTKVGGKGKASTGRGSVERGGVASKMGSGASGREGGRKKERGERSEGAGDVKAVEVKKSDKGRGVVSGGGAAAVPVGVRAGEGDVVDVGEKGGNGSSNVEWAVVRIGKGDRLPVEEEAEVRLEGGEAIVPAGRVRQKVEVEPESLEEVEAAGRSVVGGEEGMGILAAGRGKGERDEVDRTAEGEEGRSGVVEGGSWTLRGSGVEAEQRDRAEPAPSEGRGKGPDGKAEASAQEREGEDRSVSAPKEGKGRKGVEAGLVGGDAADREGEDRSVSAPSTGKKGSSFQAAYVEAGHEVERGWSGTVFLQDRVLPLLEQDRLKVEKRQEGVPTSFTKRGAVGVGKGEEGEVRTFSSGIASQPRVPPSPPSFTLSSDSVPTPPPVSVKAVA